MAGVPATCSCIAYELDDPHDLLYPSTALFDRVDSTHDGLRDIEFVGRQIHVHVHSLSPWTCIS